jgi:hypothetical protein
MVESRLHSVTVDLVALEAVVRAIARAQARLSRTALSDLLECLSQEADRLGAGAHPNDPDVAGVHGALDSWIEDIRTAGLEQASDAA